MSKKKQETPKWFKGVVYQKGATVQNPFSGESYKLNALELSIYDFIIGAQVKLLEIHSAKQDLHGVNRLIGLKYLKEITRDVHKGLHWFRQYNAKAYMILLD